MPEVAFRSDIAVFDIGQIFRSDPGRALEARGAFTKRDFELTIASCREATPFIFLTSSQNECPAK